MIPATRQSIYEQMACETGYKLVHIDGLRTPDTAESARGTDVHAVLAPYALHCARRKVSADFAYLDSLLDSATEEVATILESCRNNLSVDWQNLFAVEIHWGLDRQFRPTWSYDHEGRRIEIDPAWGIEGSGEEPAYCGISDVILLMPGGQIATTEDYKTHPRPFPADTFQGKLYALALMMHMPKLKEVTFRLRFVRYANLNTEMIYSRKDVPNMMEDCRRVRNRQKDIHSKVEDGQTLRVHGGSHCTYCPGSQQRDLCPISRMNPMLNMSPADRLSWDLWMQVASRANQKTMKDYVEGSGQEIHSQDSNGKFYTFGPVPKEKITYPLFAEDGNGGFTLPIVDALLDWQNANPEDLQPKPWFLNLRIGSTQLKSYLKAKKREIIDNAIKDLSIKEKKVELRITRDASIDDGASREYHEYEEGDY
jgi:hypothetical protein